MEYKLVPVELTELMASEGAVALHKMRTSSFLCDHAKAAWAAMLAAAPSPEEKPDAQEEA